MLNTSHKPQATIIYYSLIASTLLSANVAFTNPLGSAFKSTDNGGTLAAIDAYKDGVGVEVVDNLMTTDNSVMNQLVYTYGDAAKASGNTIIDQVLYGTGTVADKVLAGALTVNGSICSDGNALTFGETWLNGVCQGGKLNGTSCDDLNPATSNDIYTNGVCAGVISTASIVDIFGDGSAKALYTFDNNVLDSSGSYNGTPTNITYTSGKIGQAGVFTNGYVTIPSINIGSTSASFSFWFKTSQQQSGGGAQAFLDFTNGRLALSINGNHNIATYDGGYRNFTYSPPLNQLIHLTFVINGTQQSLYMNGIFQQTITGNIMNLSGILKIGSFIDNSYTLKGSIDQLRIFNKALNQTEVTKVFNEQ